MSTIMYRVFGGSGTTIVAVEVVKETEHTLVIRHVRSGGRIEDERVRKDSGWTGRYFASFEQAALFAREQLTRRIENARRALDMNLEDLDELNALVAAGPPEPHQPYRPNFNPLT